MEIDAARENIKADILIPPLISCIEMQILVIF